MEAEAPKCIPREEGTGGISRLGSVVEAAANRFRREAVAGAERAELLEEATTAAAAAAIAAFMGRRSACTAEKLKRIGKKNVLASNSFILFANLHITWNLLNTNIIESGIISVASAQWKAPKKAARHPFAKH